MVHHVDAFQLSWKPPYTAGARPGNMAVAAGWLLLRRTDEPRTRDGVTGFGVGLRAWRGGGVASANGARGPALRGGMRQERGLSRSLRLPLPHRWLPGGGEGHRLHLQ